MAYVNTIDDEDENSQGMNGSEESSSNAGPTATGSGGSGGGTTSSAAPSSPKAMQAKPASSGSSTGFQNYYKANQGIAQQRLNNAATANVANQGKQATNAINQATTSFGQKAEAGSLANRENAVKDVTDVTNAARGLTAGAAPVAPTTPAPVPATDPVTGKAIAPQTANATAANPLTETQTNRFGEVINAAYKGPESLRQAGLYQPAADKTIGAQRTLENTKTAAGREDMLKQMYQSGGNYSTGLNKLDTALLNANKQGVQSLQDTAKAQGNLGQKLDQAQISSANLAQNRTAEINRIKEEARNVFSSGKTAEEKATEDRLDAMLVTPVKDANGNPIMKPDGSPLTQWDQLPESFRDVIRNKKQTNQALLDKQVADYKGAIPASHTAAQSALNSAQSEMDRLPSIDPEGASAYDASIQYAFDGSGRQLSPEQSIAAARYSERMNALHSNLESAKATAGKTQADYDKGLADLQSNFNMDAVNFNPLEAEILGIQSGEGLYNLGENAIKTGVADRSKLISRDEQIRQAVLAQLAGLDQSDRLDTNLRYADASKAGTQNILDSLDTGATRTALDAAEENFEKTAEGTDLTGKGKKKVSRGNMFGTTTRTYKASTEANAADLLKGAGYDFDTVDEKGNPAYSKALLSELSKLDISDDTKNIERENAQAQLGQSAAGASAGFAMGGPWGALVGAALGNINQSGTFDPGQHGANLASGFTGENSMVTKGHQAFKDSFGKPISGLGNAIGGSAGGFLSNLGSSISGVDTGAMKEFGEAKARKAAMEDLQRQYTGFLKNQGFDNRVNVVNDEQNNARVASLLALMQGLDKTNT